MDNQTPVYEPGEYCEVCGATEQLGEMTLPGEFKLTVCVPCNDDRPKMTAWLASQMEAALEEDPDFERAADGTWRRVKVGV